MKILLLLLTCFTLFGEPYERFVGLGFNCTTKFQINKHLQKRYLGLDLKQFGGGQLFDWVAINDFNKLVEALDNNLIDIFEREDLIVEHHHVSFVYNVKYNMSWIHLFTRYEGYSLPENIIELEYDNRKQKIDYLCEKFKNLSQYRTLYVIAILEYIPPLKSLDLERLYTALVNLRGNDNFAILYCPIKKEFEDFSSIFVREIPFFKEPACPENCVCWDAVLSEFPYIIIKGSKDKSGMDNSWISLTRF